jgi:hypothetical protein
MELFDLYAHNTSNGNRIRLYYCYFGVYMYITQYNTRVDIETDYYLGVYLLRRVTFLETKYLKRKIIIAQYKALTRVFGVDCQKPVRLPMYIPCSSSNKYIDMKKIPLKYRKLTKLSNMRCNSVRFAYHGKH